MKWIFTTTLLFSFTFLFGQEKQEEKNYGISFSGFVKHEFFYDSRQIVNAREGHFSLWPAAELLDVNGEDINASSSLNFLAVQSRITGKIKGPDAFGAKTSGVIEGDFFGQANDNINLFRLRHAYIKLNWENTELISGQTWNPLFVTGCFPGTVSFNTGVPFQSFARNPQIRLTQSFGKIKIITALLAQRDYASRGANGVSSEYLKNATLPDMHLQVQFASNKENSGTSFLAGAGIAYKQIVPRLSSSVTDTTGTTKTYKVDEQVSGLTAIAYMNLKTKPVTIKVQYRYGENIPDVLSISGFAVKEEVNATTGELSYTPLKNTTIWGDIHTNAKKIQVGVFGGFLLNQGTKEEMSSTSNKVYGLGTNIESLFRVSPRVIYNVGKFRLAFELEYTAATYGSNYNVSYIPGTTNTVSNTRALLGTYYFF